MTAQTKNSPQTLGSLPLNFEPNRGQTPPAVLYQARGAAHGVFFTQDFVTISAQSKAHRAALEIRFENEQKDARFAPLDPLPGKSNYLPSKDPDSWVANVPTYARLAKRSIYPGVDAVFYGAGSRLEYDLHVAAGSDPKQIVMAFDGAERMEVDTRGDLVIHTGKFVFKQHRPVAYQERNGRREAIDAKYRALAGNRVEFALGSYDPRRELIIDPVLVYSTYLGGTTANEYDENAGGNVDKPAGNAGTAIKTDANGNVYVLGWTSAYDFPVTAGAYDTQVGQECLKPACYPSDSFLMKLSPAGQVIFSTYVGIRSDAFDIDADGNAYMVATEGNDEAVYAVDVIAINNTGTALLGTHTYSMLDPRIGGISVDGNKNAVIAGSVASYSFSTTPGAFQSSERCSATSTICGYLDGFVMKVDTITGNVLYATLLGGNGNDTIAAVTTDIIGNVFVAGNSDSTDFPHTHTFGTGSPKAFVAKLNATGSALYYSDFIGSAYPSAIALDGTNHAYVTGEVTSSGFPTTSNAFDRSYAGGSCPGAYPNKTCYDGFLTRFSIDGSAIQYSTMFGGGYEDNPASVALDSSGTAWVGGSTQSGGFPVTSDAFDKTYASSMCGTLRCPDGFLIAFSSSGALKYSTYFGGSGEDMITSVATDPSANVWLTGTTNSTDLFTTSNALYRTRPGASAAFIVKFASSTSTTSCNPPSSPGVNICSPAAGSTVSSPVRITAAGRTANTTVKMELWIDGSKKTTVTGNKLDYSATLGAGGHSISVYGIDSSGSKVNKKISITVK